MTEEEDMRTILKRIEWRFDKLQEKVKGLGIGQDNIWRALNNLKKTD